MEALNIIFGCFITALFVVLFMLVIARYDIAPFHLVFYKLQDDEEMGEGDER